MKKFVFFAFVCFVLAFSNCKKGPLPIPAVIKQPVLSISFKPLFNSNALKRSTYGQNVNGLGDVSLITWSMLLSNMHLIKSNGDKVKIGDGFGYFDVLNPDNQVSTTLLKGEYVGFGFDLGVDEINNHADPAVWGPTHPLNVNLNGMHWGWAGGYIFHVFEGAYKTTPTVTPKGFSYHTATDAMLSSFKFDKTISLKDDVNTNLNFTIDADKLFAKMDIANVSTNHSGSANEILKQKIIVEEMKTAFKLP